MMFAAMGALGLAPSAHAAAAADYVPPAQADLRLSGRKRPRVVILGAGVTGLATAYELGKAGYDCRLLEAMDRVGGRSWTVRRGARLRETDGMEQISTFAEGQYFNAGPARIAQWMVTLDYCRELGVAIEPIINSNHDSYFYLVNAGPLAGKAIRKRTAMADVYGYVAELLAKATDQGALDAMLTDDDKDNLLDFLSDWGALGPRVGHDPDDSWLYTGTERRGFATFPGAGDQRGVPLGPPPSLSAVLASHTGNRLVDDFDVEQAMPMYQPVGGMDQLAHALARAVGEHRVTRRARVEEIANHGHEVHVAYRDERGRRRLATGDYCVATMPPHQLARLRHNLGAAITAALRTPLVAKVGKIGLEYRRRWWEEDHRIFGGITKTDLEIEQIWYPSTGYLGKRGVVVGYYTFNPETAQDYGRMRPAQRTRRAVAAGERIHGRAYRTELASAFSIAWHKVPHIEGAWANWAPSDSGRQAFDLLLKPAGRVYFAGDWLTQLPTWQAGALDSARAVATAVHKRVLAS